MTGSKYKVLVVEDEANIRNFVKTILETNSYQVFDAKNAREAKMIFTSYAPDILVLDLGLPDGDGIDLIKMVRETCTIPIIVLSARTNEEDKVAALDVGANDYVTKPFGTRELLARMRAALRIYHQHSNGVKKDGKFRVDDLEIDFDNRVVTVAGEDVKLTQTEYNIVALLAIHSGRVLTYAEIIREVWRWSDLRSVKKLQVNMANIRKKLGVKPGDNKYILNELGVGYKMDVGVD